MTLSILNVIHSNLLTLNLSDAHLKKIVHSYICINKNITNQCSQRYTFPLIKSEHFHTLINTYGSNHLSCEDRMKYCMQRSINYLITLKNVRYFLSLNTFINKS